MKLASNGMVVLAIAYTDGSSIGYKTPNGTFVPHDMSIGKLYKSKDDQDDYNHVRCTRTSYRESELDASLQALKSLNIVNLPHMDQESLSFVGRLDINDVTLMGHL